MPEHDSRDGAGVVNEVVLDHKDAMFVVKKCSPDFSFGARSDFLKERGIRQ